MTNESQIAEQLSERRLYTITVTPPYQKSISTTIYESPLQIEQVAKEYATNARGDITAQVSVAYNNTIVVSIEPTYQYMIYEAYVVTWYKRRWFRPNKVCSRIFFYREDADNFIAKIFGKDFISRKTVTLVAYGNGDAITRLFTHMRLSKWQPLC